MAFTKIYHNGELFTRVNCANGVGHLETEPILWADQPHIFTFNDGTILHITRWFGDENITFNGGTCRGAGIVAWTNDNQEIITAVNSGWWTEGLRGAMGVGSGFETVAVAYDVSAQDIMDISYVKIYRTPTGHYPTSFTESTLDNECELLLELEPLMVYHNNLFYNHAWKINYKAD